MQPEPIGSISFIDWPPFTGCWHTCYIKETPPTAAPDNLQHWHCWEGGKAPRSITVLCIAYVRDVALLRLRGIYSLHTLVYSIKYMRCFLRCIFFLLDLSWASLKITKKSENKTHTDFPHPLAEGGQFLRTTSCLEGSFICWLYTLSIFQMEWLSLAAVLSCRWSPFVMRMVMVKFSFEPKTHCDPWRGSAAWGGARNARSKMG